MNSGGDADVTCGESNLTAVIKSEPQDDHDYGAAENSGRGHFNSQSLNAHVNSNSVVKGMEIDIKREPPSPERSPMLASMLISTTVGRSVTSLSSPIQTMVSPSVITSQPLTLIPLQTAGIASANAGGLLRVMPVSPTKHSGSSQGGQGSSPVVTMAAVSPSRNVVLKGVGSLTSPVVMETKPGGSMQKTQVNATMPQLIAFSSLTGKSTMSFAMPHQLVLTNSVNGQPVIQSTVPVQNSSPVKVHTTSAQQQTGSGLIFLKCTDSSGKTFLIPQQMCSTSSMSIKSQSSPSSAAVKLAGQGSQPVILATSLTGVASTTKTNSPPNPSSATCVQAGVRTVQPVGVTVPACHPSIQNGPVLFLKPESSSSVRKGPNFVPGKAQEMAPIRFNTIVATPQGLRTVSPSQGLAQGVRGQQVMTTGSQSLLRGQLKVTPQGLIQIQGQKTAVSISQTNTNTLHLNGNSRKPNMANKSKQPLILVPTTVNNKLIGQGKSLLTNNMPGLSSTQGNGNIIVFNQASAIQNSHPTVGKLEENPNVTMNKASVNNNSVNIHTKGISNSKKTCAISVQSNVLKSPPNHIMIVPMSSHQNVTMTTCTQNGSGHILASKPNGTSVVVNSGGSSNTSGKIMTSSARSQDRTMLIVVQNDKNKLSPISVNKTSAHVPVVSMHAPKAMASLLGSRSKSSIITMTTSDLELPVTISSSDRKDKQIIIVNEKEMDLDVPSESSEKDKKIIVVEGKRRKLQQKPKGLEMPEFVMPLW